MWSFESDTMNRLFLENDEQINLYLLRKVAFKVPWAAIYDVFQRRQDSQHNNTQLCDTQYKTNKIRHSA